MNYTSLLKKGYFYMVILSYIFYAVALFGIYSYNMDYIKELNDLKTRFVSMASHEFRTPLSTILSSISLLAKYQTTEDQPRRDKHIDRIKSSVKNLTDILNEFLSLGKIEEGKVDVKLEDFNLKDFVDRAISAFLDVQFTTFRSVLKFPSNAHLLNYTFCFCQKL